MKRPSRPTPLPTPLLRARQLLREGRSDAAEAAFRAVAAADPRCVEALQMAGAGAGQRGQVQEGIGLLQQALALRPDDPQLLNNLGNAYGAAGRPADALACFDRSLRQRPGHAGTQANRSRALVKLERADEALAAVDAALAGPNVNAGLYELRAQILTQRHAREPTMPHLDAAVAALQAALRHGGDADELNFVLASLGAAPTPPRAPAKSVAEAFDRGADSFDSHLVDQLHYQGPTLVMKVVQRLALQPPCDVIDLGCGTGLCAPSLRPLARQLVGVDLSAGMLAQAARRGLYDELLQDDLVAVLTTRPAAWDLAVAVDVLIYVGAVDPVFGALGQALRPGGHFVFTAEAHEGDGMALGPTRRYAHGRHLLQDRAAAHGLAVQAWDDGVLRIERGRPVAGWIVALRRPAGDETTHDDVARRDG
ncbi:MAG: tetratricopeptide repeat protein [Aquabacterium sp.]